VSAPALRGTRDGVGLTHDEIGRRLGVSRVRVGQIERAALAKMYAAVAASPASFANLLEADDLELARPPVIRLAVPRELTEALS